MNGTNVFSILNLRFLQKILYLITLNLLRSVVENALFRKLFREHTFF